MPSKLAVALVTALFLVQILRAVLQASREELGNHPRPSHDGMRLILTGIAVVAGLVLLIVWIAHPGTLQGFGGSGLIVPVAAFMVFVYIIFVIGVSSSHRTSGEKSRPWLDALALFVGAILVLGLLMLTAFSVAHAPIPRRYQMHAEVGIVLAVVFIWEFMTYRRLRLYKTRSNPRGDRSQ